MAKLAQGTHGAYSGKMGNTIGASWKGISYIRIKPARIANPRTPAQLAQRAKFKMMLDFLRPLKPALSIGYKEFAVRKTALNCAMSYNLQNAVETLNGTNVIKYDEVLISRGSRKTAKNPTAAIAGPAEVIFTWDDNSDLLNAHDQAILVVYNPSKDEAVIETTGGKRMDTNQSVMLPADFAGDTVHTWIAFASPNGRHVSNSKYTGEVVVQ